MDKFALSSLKIGQLLVVATDKRNSSSKRPEDVYEIIEQGDQPMALLRRINSLPVQGGASCKIIGSQEPYRFHKGLPMSADDYGVIHTGALVVIKVSRIANRKEHWGSGAVKTVRIKNPVRRKSSAAFAD